jgi:hypothetical protein
MKTIDKGIIILGLVFVSIFGLMLYNSNRSVPAITPVTETITAVESPPAPFEILTVDGECWVVKRDLKGLIKESLFHDPSNLRECITWIGNQY